MIKKLMLVFLFALGLSGSYAFADEADDAAACVDGCVVKYNDCMRDFSLGYCSQRLQQCSARCEGNYELG